jgi:hypothetical protein
MRLSYLVAFALIALPACADEELRPETSSVLEAPEYSENREPFKTAGPPPPIRERRLDTTPETSRQMIYITGDVGPVATQAQPTFGTVNALDKH